MIRKTRFATLSIACAAITLYAASPALAGEINGRGDPIPATDHAASACAFSGLNDNPVNPPPMDFPGRVQSFGAFMKFLSGLFGFQVHPFDMPSYPGEGCLGNLEEEPPL
jgi:hypothetical protein